MSNRQPHKRTQRVLLSITALAAAAGLAGVGTYASFTGSVGASQTVSTGTMSVTLGAVGPANRLTVNATAFAPSDTMQRAVNVNVAGTVDLASMNLTTTDTVATPTVLSTDTTNGLKIAVDRCSQAWTEAGVAPAYTYTCGGVTSVVIATAPIVGAARAMNNMVVAAGSTNFLRITISLPATADDTFQAKTATISELFSGVQRAGIAQ
ncbi:MAG: TasA family protein [Pseudonocardiales bacterium]